MFGTAHALCFAPAPCAGDPFSLPHVWLKFFVYTYKFTFDYRIITTQMSFLYALWCHLFRRFPTLAEYLRWYPTPSDHDPSLVLRYFRFPFDYPSPPIRRLLEQWWPKCPPRLLLHMHHTFGHFFYCLPCTTTRWNSLISSEDINEQHWIFFCQTKCALSC